MDNLLESTGVQAGGYTVTVSAVGLWLIEWFSQFPVDFALKVGMGIGGMLFVYYKVASQRLQKKINQQIFDENERKRKREIEAENNE